MKKYLNQDGLLYFWQQLKTYFVPRVEGKGLSTNDYTTTEKNKLTGIAEGAQVNTVASVAGKTGAVTLAKGDVELSNVDNTSDENKPVSTAQQTALNSKVDKVSGKGLSTEDYTTTEKTKLTGIAEGATANSAYASTPSMDGTASAGSSADFARGDHIHPTDTSRAALNSPAFTGTPTAPTAALGTSTTQIATTAFVKDVVTDALSDITGISFEVVETLPAVGASGRIYLLSNSGSGGNVYDEYIWYGGAWEKIGSTDIDLSGYQLKSELVAITNTEIDNVLTS